MTKKEMTEKFKYEIKEEIRFYIDMYQQYDVENNQDAYSRVCSAQDTYLDMIYLFGLSGGTLERLANNFDKIILDGWFKKGYKQCLNAKGQPIILCDFTKLIK